MNSVVQGSITHVNFAHNRLITQEYGSYTVINKLMKFMLRHVRQGLGRPVQAIFFLEPLLTLTLQRERVQSSVMALGITLCMLENTHLTFSRQYFDKTE